MATLHTLTIAGALLSKGDRRVLIRYLNFSLPAAGDVGIVNLDRRQLNAVIELLEQLGVDVYEDDGGVKVKKQKREE